MNSWSLSLEQWAQQHFGTQLQPVGSTMAFAPSKTLSHQMFYRTPVVIFVVTERTRRLHRALYEAVDLLRESTYAFRAVAFTDTLTSPGLRSVDWTVEHCMDEDSWRQLSSEDWLTEAAGQLSWAQRQYGASYVLAPSTAEEVIETVEFIGLAYKAAHKVRQTALELARQHLPAEEASPGEVVTVQGLRGWWQHLPAGNSQRRVQLDDGELILSIRRRESEGLPGYGAVVATSSAALEAGRLSADWSTVTIEHHGAATGVGDDSAEAVRAAGASTQDLIRLSRAAADALAGGGPALLLTSALLDAAGPLAAPPKAETPTQGVSLPSVVTLGDDGTGQAVMSYGSVVEFPAAELPRVLEELRTVHARAMS